MIFIENKKTLEAVKVENTKQVLVLSKALSILRTLQETKDGMGLTEISKQSKVNKASCYRILYTFMNDNIVEQGVTPGTYRLGLRLLELGSVVQSRIDLRQKALPELSKLAKTTEETVFLCIMNNNKATCIERIEGNHVQVLALKVGDIWPLYLGAASRSILANLPNDKIHEILSVPIIKKTPKTPIDPGVYWQMIDEIRRNGFSFCSEDFTLGVASIGAPIFDHKGIVVGAISISTIIQLITPERKKELINLILETSKNISKSMGYKVTP